MNKKLYLFLILCYTAFNDSTRAQDLFVGFKGGLNVSDITVDPLNRAKFGLHLGGYFGLKFTEQFGGSVELLYTQKGTHHKNPNPVIQDDYDVMVSIDYMDLPLLFHYYVTPEFNLHTGFTIGFPVRAVRDFRYPPFPYGRPGNQYYTRREDFFNADGFYHSVVSFPIGLSYEIAQRLNLGIRGDFGLTPVGRNGHKNVVLMLSVGYTFFRKGVNLSSAGKKK